MKMRVSKNGIALIKKHEGFISTPYLCPAGVPTIGYGCTFYPDGRKVSMSDSKLTEEQATQMLIIVVDSFAEKVEKLIKTQVNQNQFDSLVSFAYNIGIGALQKSTLLKKVNAQPLDKSIRDEFMKWNRGGGKVLNGLVKRRLDESDLYFK